MSGFEAKASFNQCLSNTSDQVLCPRLFQSHSKILGLWSMHFLFLLMDGEINNSYTHVGNSVKCIDCEDKELSD